jgi:hypothetical protein
LGWQEPQFDLPEKADEAKVENFFSVWVDSQYGHFTAVSDEPTSSSNSRPHAAHIYSYNGISF